MAVTYMPKGDLLFELFLFSNLVQHSSLGLGSLVRRSVEVLLEACRLSSLLAGCLSCRLCSCARVCALALGLRLHWHVDSLQAQSLRLCPVM